MQGQSSMNGIGHLVDPQVLFKPVWGKPIVSSALFAEILQKTLCQCDLSVKLINKYDPVGN